MKLSRFSALAAGMIVVATVLLGCANMPGQTTWITLVDGANGLENWNRVGDAN